MAQVQEAFEALRQIPGAKVFKSSFSSSLVAYDKKTVISRLEMWCAWHSAWVYKEEPSFRWNDPMFPLPPCFSRIRPELFNVGDAQEMSPVVDEFGLDGQAIFPMTVDGASRTRRISCPLGEQNPLQDAMDTGTTSDEAYANRLCESDVTSG